MPGRVRSLRDLAALEASAGTTVSVEEVSWTATSLGSAPDQITARLAWPRRTVWLTDHALAAIRADHGGALPSVEEAARAVVAAPEAVLENPRLPDSWLFVRSAEPLRRAGLLTSRSSTYLEGLVELRQVAGGAYLALFHLSPVRHVRGGAQRWP